MLMILHLAYAFVPAGYILGGLSAFDRIAASAGIHAWTGGAIGTMAVAVTSRATYGHPGRQLEAPLTTQVIYATVFVAALTRVNAVLEAQFSEPLLAVARVAWATAFVGFAACYAAALSSPKQV